MKKSRVITALALLSALILIAFPILGVKGVVWPLIWEGDVSSSGAPVTTPFPLEAGREYRIVAKGVFIASMDGIVYFAMDAQYYTPNPIDPWWTWEPANTFPAPDGHSFLQIDGGDPDWGPFSNGEPGWVGHEYSINYTGTGAPITFAIVDWTEPLWPMPLNHWCSLRVRIYEGPPAPPEAETAFAYGGDYATCFKHWGFKNWGWSNGPLEPGSYEFDLYAGAAKCNIRKGTLVGTLTINYDGETAIVTYTMDAGWMMQRTQLYVDGEPLPRNGGEYTVSPGQYPYIHDPVVDPAIDTHTVTGLSGNIYVVAHADVFEV